MFNQRPDSRYGESERSEVVGGIIAMMAAQLLFTYAPFMNKLFHSAPISGRAWLEIIAVGLVVFLAVEFKKWVAARSRAVEHPASRPQDP